MIIKGGARSSGGFFAYHLMKTEENERVEVKEMRGLLADTVPEAFQEMRMVAAGTRAENYFYHASINPREDEHLTPEQWEFAVDRLEQNLGLTDHARFQVEHEKEGRTHRHIVWSRVDVDSMTVTPASGNYLAHDKTRLELEREFQHEPTSPTPEPSQRKSREFAEWENWRGAESGIDPKAMKAEITALWQQSDGGRAFQAAIEEQGYLLAKGDRRDFVVIDPSGDIHSLGRRVDAKAADIRAKMVDLDRDSLMTAQQASAWMKGKEEAENSGSSDARILPEEQVPQYVTPPEMEQELAAAKAILFSQQKPFLLPEQQPPRPFSDEILAAMPPDHPLLAEPVVYVRPQSMEESVAIAKAMLRHRAETFTPADWAALATKQWDTYEAFEAQLEQDRQAQATLDHAPPEGEPLIEAVTYAQAARGVDPPQHLSEREPLKRATETWVEYVTKAMPLEQTEGKDKSEEKEPELER